MKTLWRLYYKFTMKNYDSRIEDAKNLFTNLKESTKGSINHFYDMNGDKIRGYSNIVIRSRRVEHPLIAKYH